MNRNRQTAPSETRGKRVTIHPELYSMFGHQSVDEHTSIQELIHVALCRQVGRLDLIPEPAQATA